MRTGLVMMATICAAATANAGETLRCGRWLVDESATVDELLKKCGEPSSVRSSESDVRALGPTGAMIKVGTVTTHEWTYDRGRQAAAIVVTIVGDKIRSMKRVER
jgi:hypothetical protein